MTLDALNRALRHVQRELDAAGLYEGCLDQIEVVLAYWPSGWWGECGFVYDRGVGGLAKLAGFREGVIYVPWNAPISRRRGETLRDVLRHEYAHALAWARPSFVRGKWFREACGAGYDEEWDERPAFDPEVYVSEYATVSAKEDFAETFAAWLRGASSSKRGKPDDRSPRYARRARDEARLSGRHRRGLRALRS